MPRRCTTGWRDHFFPRHAAAIDMRISLMTVYSFALLGASTGAFLGRCQFRQGVDAPSGLVLARRDAGALHARQTSFMLAPDPGVRHGHRAQPFRRSCSWWRSTSSRSRCSASGCRRCRPSASCWPSAAVALITLAPEA